MRSPILSNVYAASVFLVCLITGVAQAQEPPTLDQIITGIERMDQTFFESDSLLIHYARTQTRVLIPGSISEGLLPVEWRLAYRDNKWFAEQVFLEPANTKESYVPAKPETIVINESGNLDWKQDGRYAIISQFHHGTNIFNQLEYTRNLSLNAPSRVAKTLGVTFDDVLKDAHYQATTRFPFLPEFLVENKRHYKVLPIPEKVDDNDCWVVEWPGMDRFWVDPVRGFAIPRRAYCWAPDKPRRFEVWNRDYRLVKAGLWLPFAMSVDIYGDIVADRESLWGKATVRTEYSVRSLEFDRVPEALFDVHLPPGTKVIDEVRDFAYTVTGPDNADPFDAAMAEAMKQKGKSFFRPWVIFNFGVLLLIALFLYWFRFRRNVGKSV